MKFLLTADEAAGLHTFRLLNKSPHEIAAVITPEKNLLIRNLASRLSIPVIAPVNVTRPAFADWVRDQQIDVLLNVHLLYIIHPDILNAVSVGGFNLHPGPLPAYAGLNTPSWAIYNGESEFGVTLHWLEAGIDTGHIAYQETLNISPDETGLSLSTKCAKAGIELISRLINDLAESSPVPRIPQDLSQRKYFGKRTRPQNGYINWAQSSSKIDAFVRACSYSPFRSPWGHPKTTFNGSDIEILSVHTTLDPCSEKPGTIQLINEEQIRVASSDFWLTIKTCGIGGRNVPAKTVFHKGGFLW